MAAKVKIQTALPSNFGHTVDFNGLSLHFDKLGFAEVESMDIAKKLADTYVGWLFIGEKPKQESKHNENEDFQDLVKENDRLNEKIKDREASIHAISQECEEWKDQVNKYKTRVEAAEEELDGFKAQSDKIIKELELKVQLAKKNMKDLVEVCTTLEIPEERFKGKNKDEVIMIILDESRNK